MPQPPFKKTKKQAEQVLRLVAGGYSERDIHVRLGISRDTLRTYYPEELANGRAIKRAEIIGMLEAAAKAGNVSAMKKLYEIYSGEPSAPNSAGYVGKKQLQAEAAFAAGGTEWGNDLRTVMLSDPDIAASSFISDFLDRS